MERKYFVEIKGNLEEMIRKERNLPRHEEICIKKARIDKINGIMYLEYEGKTRIGFILYDFVEKMNITSVSGNSWVLGDDKANSCRNLLNHGKKYWIKDKNIVEYRFKVSF